MKLDYIHSKKKKNNVKYLLFFQFFFILAQVFHLQTGKLFTSCRDNLSLAHYVFVERTFQDEIETNTKHTAAPHC